MGWRLPGDVIINMQDMYDSVIYPELEVALITTELGERGGKKILGKALIKENAILIDRSIAGRNDSVFALTIAHEVAHILLHTEQDVLFPYTAEETIFNKYSLNEMHANRFARNLVMPDAFVAYRFVYHYGVQVVYTGPGDYCIDQKNVFVSSFSDFCQKLAEPLTHYFSNVSKEELGYRLRSSIKNTTVNPEDKKKMEQLAPNFYATRNFVEEYSRG
jgi:Zn-dependent peptidase ImmA (M78 family)